MKSKNLMIALILFSVVCRAQNPTIDISPPLSGNKITLPTSPSLFIKASPGYQGVGSDAVFEAITTNYIPLNYMWAVLDSQNETLIKGFNDTPETEFSFDPVTLCNGEYRITLASESTSGSVITSMNDYLFIVEWPTFSISAESWPTNPVTPGDASLTFSASVYGKPSVLQAVTDAQSWEIGPTPFILGSTNNVVLDTSYYNSTNGEAHLVIDGMTSEALEYDTDYVVHYCVSNPMSSEGHSVDFTFSSEPLPDNPPAILSYKLSSSLNSVIIKFDQNTNHPEVGSTTELNQLLSSSHSMGVLPLGIWQNASTLVVFLGPSYELEPNESTVTILPGGNLRHISGQGGVSTNTSPPLSINIDEVADLTVTIFGPSALSYNGEGRFLSEVENAGARAVSYAWSVDGLVTTGLEINAPEFIIPGAFAPAGRYEIALAVTDFLGREATAHHVFEVREPPTPVIMRIGPEYFPLLRISVNDPGLQYELQATTNLTAAGGGWYTVDGPKTGSSSYNFRAEMDLPAQFFRAVVQIPQVD